MFHKRGPMSFSRYECYKGTFLVWLVSVVMNVPNPLQLKSDLHVEQTDRITRFNGSDLLLRMLACVNVSFYDSLSKQTRGLWKDAVHSSRTAKLCFMLKAAC